MSNKEAYRSLAAAIDLPLHFQPTWYDATCVKGDWDAVILTNSSGGPEGVLPYHYRSYRTFKFILMPPMTAYGGPWLFYPDGLKNHSKISFQNKVIKQLYDQLPDHDMVYQQWHPGINNWLPLYWDGYNQSTRYTYKINLQTDKEKLWNELKGSIRTNIRNTEALCYTQDITFEEFWDHLDKSWNIKGNRNPFNRTVLQRIHSTFFPLGACSIRGLRTQADDSIIAGIFTCKDHHTQYYMSGFYYPDTRPKSAFSFLMWQTINNSTAFEFDFEGSIMPDIEYFFRGFGGRLTPHYKIWKVQHPLLKLGFMFKKPPFLD